MKLSTAHLSPEKLRQNNDPICTEPLKRAKNILESIQSMLVVVHTFCPLLCCVCIRMHFQHHAHLHGAGFLQRIWLKKQSSNAPGARLSLAKLFIPGDLIPWWAQNYSVQFLSFVELDCHGINMHQQQVAPRYAPESKPALFNKL
jgi:hypothetical protein